MLIRVPDKIEPMANPTPPLLDTRRLQSEDSEGAPVCVMTFNANDPSGTAGLTADITAITSAGGHPLAVVTGAYIRDTSEILSHVAFDEEAVTDQARMALEDMPAGAIKVGFVGTPENISAIAEIASDYADVPLIAYMPNLSWWDEAEIESYLDAFRELNWGLENAVCISIFKRKLLVFVINMPFEPTLDSMNYAPPMSLLSDEPCLVVC